MISNEQHFYLNAFSLIKNVSIANIVKNLNNLYHDIKFDIKKINDLEELIINFISNQNSTYEKLIIAKLTDLWSIIFYDSIRSDGGYSNLYNYNRLFGYEGVVIAYNNMGTVFNYFQNKNKRTVYSIKENKWTFYQEGIPLEFENLKYYSRRKIKDRINEPIIREYLGKIGISNLEYNLLHSSNLYLAKKQLINRVKN